MTAGIKEVMEALRGAKLVKKLDYKKSDARHVRGCIEDIGLAKCLSIARWAHGKYGKHSHRYFSFLALVDREKAAKPSAPKV